MSRRSKGKSVGKYRNNHRNDTKKEYLERETALGGATLAERLAPDVKSKLEKLARTLDATAKAMEGQVRRPWLEFKARKRISYEPGIASLRPAEKSRTVSAVASTANPPNIVTVISRLSQSVAEQAPRRDLSGESDIDRRQQIKIRSDFPGNKVLQPKLPTQSKARIGTPLSKVQKQVEERPWSLSAAYAVQRSNPPQATEAQQNSFYDILRAGTNASGTKGRPGTFPVIGLDFGTSSTKAIVRLYGEAGDPTYAIEMPSWALSEDNKYLWQTFLSCDDNGHLLPWLSGNSAAVDNLKTGVMFEPGTRLAGKGLKQPTYLEATTAYLAYVVRYIRGWMLKTHPEAFQEREITWSVNIGLPAEKADEAELSYRYRHATAAALMIADSDWPIAIDACRAALNHSEVKTWAKSEKTLLARGVSIVPEVAAEVAGWARSTSRQDGLYAIIDVGASTLDICTFRLNRNEIDDDRYNILMAEVRPFGVEAEKWFAAEGKTQADFQYQCEWQRNRVVWPTYRSRDPNAACWEKSDRLPVFVCGGGAANPLHSRVIKGIQSWLTERIGNAGANIILPSKPAGLAMAGDDAMFARMAVAWGLSYPRLMIGEVITPSMIENMPDRVQRHTDSNFIGKEDV